jgi:hypothetical protein
LGVGATVGDVGLSVGASVGATVTTTPPPSGSAVVARVVVAGGEPDAVQNPHESLQLAAM